jgi:energy-coupling factor transporter ATP-binding protein EcfA2
VTPERAHAPSPGGPDDLPPGTAGMRVHRPGGVGGRAGPDADSAVLEARGLSVAPAGVREPVVRDVGLALGPGEWLAVTGPNGCGKTTLALTLAGLLAPREGVVLLAGHPIGPAMPPASRAPVSVILQDPANQLLQRTVLDEVQFAARNLGLQDAGARAAELVESLGLDGEAGDDPRTLSAGRQQLVLLAAALATGPRLLVGDEPFVHLDAAARERAAAVLGRARAGGMAAVWVGEVVEGARVLELGGASSAMEEGLPPAGHAPPALVLDVAPVGPDATGPRVVTRRGMSIPVRGRGVTALLGRNGVGKSVLLAAAAGVLELRQVRVRWSRSAPAPPLYVSQHPDEQLFEELAGDELMYAALARGMNSRAVTAAAMEALREAGLPEETVSRRTWALSGGEKRILVTLAALIAPAGLIALDEPTAGLDAARRASVGRAIWRISNQLPVLIATQDRSFARWLGATCWELP